MSLPFSLHFERRKNILLSFMLVLLFLAGLSLRLDSAAWGLPFRLHPDEWKYVSAAGNCHLGAWNPKYFRNPPGFSYLNAAWYPLWIHITPPVEVPSWLGIDPLRYSTGRTVEETFLYRPFDLVLGGRYLSALFGAMIPIAVFFLARGWMANRYALGAVLFSTVSFAHVRECHFAVNDPAAACLATWTLVAAMHGYRTRIVRWMYVSAALGGMAVAFKYNMFPILLAAMVLRGIAYWNDRTGQHISMLIRDLLFMGGIAGIVFLVICPFPILDAPTFWSEIGRLSRAANHPWQGQDTRWSGLQLVESIRLSEGMIISILALAGLLVACRQKRWDMLVFPFLYGLLVCAHPLFFVRFSLPLLPWVSIGAAFALSRGITKWVQRSFLSWGVYLLILLCCIIEPLGKDFRSNALLKQPDTRVEFLHWIHSDYGAPYRVALDQFSIPLVYRGIADFWTRPLDSRIVYMDRLSSNDLQKIKQVTPPIRLIAVSTFVALPGHIPDSYEQRRESVRAFLGDPPALKTFQPYRNGDANVPIDSEDVYSPFRNLWLRMQPGPYIDVFPVGDARQDR